mmetsp:Transcript_33356/g.50321  ORF Transcript_33356/g.50321 Transcript_33356/m.50321 type:complete len:238 (-) Transcript_33356:177-890(-)
MVGVWQDLSARSSLEALEQMQPRMATVLRSDSGWTTGCDATQLVPGDIIRVSVGDSFPADARLCSLSSSSMNVDESSLTGESVSEGKLPGDEALLFNMENRKNGSLSSMQQPFNTTVPIQDQESMLFSGCLVTRGSGTALVVRTGPFPQIGNIQSTLAEAAERDRKTPLGEQLDEFGITLSYVIGGICLAVWVASIPRFNDAAFDYNWLGGAIYYANVGVALGVAVIPEGLPVLPCV